ncbi:MAG: DUF3786 domain-containing protein [Candidatus Omnitrophica bacterium]|nr:DUF3786 domain-containing protein [Candidatus Omnitrophota bacterium]
MSYAAALKKAWEEIEPLSKCDKHSVTLLSDVYECGVKNKTVMSRAANAPAKEFLSVLILHYLAASLKGSYRSSGEWVSFKDLEGGEIYYAAFREGVIKPLLKKFADKAGALVRAAERLKGRAIEEGDAGVEIESFEGVPVRIIIWRSDEEFGPEATMLYDKNIKEIFPTEDVAVLSRFIAHKI